MAVILITGAAGAIGQALLGEMEDSPHRIIATDIRPPHHVPEGAVYRPMDVRGSDPVNVIRDEKPDVIVHLASIVTPPPGATREFAYNVDVNGTRNVLTAAVAARTRRIVVTSSGAAYGYHPDNPVPLGESAPLRGNAEFPYAYHKRLVEEMLADARRDNPALEQVVLRVGTVLGAGLENQITRLFQRKRLLAVWGSESPFVFIWTQDLARILLRAATDGPPGIYNVAGDGAVGVSDMARSLNKPVLRLPPALLKRTLAIARPLKLTQYGPEQVRFLQYRPVLDNRLLKDRFGYVPDLTSAEVFEKWRRATGL